MGLLGRFVHIRGHLFSRRKHALQTSGMCDRWERALIFDPTKAGKTTFPFLWLAHGFYSAIGRVQLPRSERFRCYKHFHHWLWKHGHYVRGDLREGVISTIKRLLTKGQFDRLKSLKCRLNTVFHKGPGYVLPGFERQAHGKSGLLQGGPES
jgi:hypothetical protein